MTETRATLTAETLQVTVAPELSQSLTELQITAVDLYLRGLNVLPMPHPAWLEANGHPADDKTPFILTQFYTGRLHLCGPECARRTAKTGRKCKGANYVDLFETPSNIGLMTGRTSGNLFVIDTDSHTDAAAMKAELDRRGLPYWSWRTRRGAAFAMRLIEGEADNQPGGETGRPVPGYPDTQIWGNTRFCVCPPSSYYIGAGVYTWLTPEPRFYLPPFQGPPAVHLADLAFLDVKLYRPGGWTDPELHGLPQWAAMLSKPNRAILATVHPEGTRNSELTKPTYDIAALIDQDLITYREGEAVLIDAAELSNYPVKAIRGMLKSALKKNPTRATTSGGTLQPWARALTFAEGYNWRIYGRAAQSVRGVFLACCERSKMDNSDTFRATEREVAELANLSRDTAHKALRRLSDHNTDARPLLVRVKPGNPKTGEPNVYGFTAYATSTPEGGAPVLPLSLHCSNSGRFGAPENDTLPATLIQQDVFNRRGLGANAYRIWEYCKANREHTTSTPIAAALNLHPGSVRKALKRLIEADLVRRGGDGAVYSVEVGEDKLEVLSAMMDTLGTADKRKREHTKDREVRLNVRVGIVRARWLEKRIADLKASEKAERATRKATTRGTK